MLLFLAETGTVNSIEVIMCGIAGFLSNVVWQDAARLDWLDTTLAQLEQVDVGAVQQLDTAVAGLADYFDELMRFSTHLAVVQDARVRRTLERLTTALKRLEAELLTATLAKSDQAIRQLESVRDYRWQIQAEVLDNVERTLKLLPGSVEPGNAGRARHFVAWGIEQVMENLDRLEVRGRDSAGLVVQLTLDPAWSVNRLPAALQTELDHRSNDVHAESGGVLLHLLSDGRHVCRFVYKVANLIGRLGDNGSNLRAAIRSDALLWELARVTQQLGILAHTRWASNGIINLANCHPVNASLAGDKPGTCPSDANVVGVLNGDVDNYQQLATSAVESRRCAIPPAIRTDAKIIPILFRLDTLVNEPLEERVLAVMRRLEGSMAIGLLHPDDPDHLYLSQKGSGQSLFVATTPDGWMLASEVYGLAARTRRCLPLVQVGRGGVQVTLTGNAGLSLRARLIDNGEPVELAPETIEIFSRDIYRGHYDYFLEKEIHEAPSSVRKTLQGRYRKAGRQVNFNTGEHNDLEPLLARLSDPSLPPLRRIMVTGQGTASIAAMGVAYLIQKALDGAPIVVDWAKASELSTSFGKRSLKDTLVVAISQSGTTTDTNRTVDLARADGAWVHAIVNRRNSPLVRKSDSRLFTSDGRDVEMAVASTKAFYSQVAAGKLTALCLAQALSTLDPAQLYAEILALESLPERIQEVLAQEEQIAACATAYAPRHRYWAVVGNGPNKIAAEEIRIKLSELCYRSIPCDFTEDKKHIDLSTEPLTLVVANDLPQLVAQDTAKEVAIFKAHNGKPIVFAALGETCFEPYAEATLYLPSVGAGLDFVIAAVAGHVWGFHAAKAIDRTAVPFRQVAALLASSLEAPAQAPLPLLQSELSTLLDTIAQGDLDAALPPRIVAQVSQYLGRLAGLGADPAIRSAVFSDGIMLMKTAYDELSRPIDSIRHQAKTVTVGISRPQKEIAPLLQRALAELGVVSTGLADRDRQMLIGLSPFLAGVEGGVLYKVVGGAYERDDEEVPVLQLVHQIGSSAGRASAYAQPQPAAGSKRRALRLSRAIVSTGPHHSEHLLLLPVFDEQQWVCEHLALFHLAIIPQASLQQKMTLLKELGSYEDAFEAFQEVQPDGNFAAFLEATSPHDLIFTPSFRVLVTGGRMRAA
jgi:glucosamine--fructose-6-phosphate aminotransferase (isomerizing)